MSFLFLSLSKPDTGTNFVSELSAVRGKSCHFIGTKSVKTVRYVTHSSRHVVPSVKDKIRTVHEMHDTQCHACARNNFVATSRDTFGIFLNISQFSPRHCTHYVHLTRIAMHASPSTLSRILTSLALHIACHGVKTVCRASVSLALIVSKQWWRCYTAIQPISGACPTDQPHETVCHWICRRVPSSGH